MLEVAVAPPPCLPEPARHNARHKGHKTVPRFPRPHPPPVQLNANGQAMALRSPTLALGPPLFLIGHGSIGHGSSCLVTGAASAPARLTPGYSYLRATLLVLCLHSPTRCLHGDSILSA